MSESERFLSPGHQRALKMRAERVAELRRQLEGVFPAGASLTLEVGCGHGHYLTAFAEQHPDAYCLGVDLVTRRIEKACAKRDKRRLQGLHFLKADAWECLDALPPGVGLNRIFVLFPDPWPKKRHEKNRLLQHSLLTALASRALPAALLHFRTDHEGLFEWGFEQLETHPSWTVDTNEAWPLEAGSYFQDMLGVYKSVSARVADPSPVA